MRFSPSTAFIDLPASAPIHPRSTFICRKIHSFTSQAACPQSTYSYITGSRRSSSGLKKRRLELKVSQVHDKSLVSPIHLACQTVTCSSFHNPDKCSSIRNIPGFTSPVINPLTPLSLSGVEGFVDGFSCIFCGVCCTRRRRRDG
jgi:hypothetical protein